MNLSTMSDRELADLQTAILQEQNLRRRLDASPEKIERAIAEYQKATGKGSGEAWEQPTGPMDAYRRGAIVEHEGRIWESTHGNNVHSPGQSGWRLKPEVDEDGNEIPPPYVQPAGNHDSYQEGERVTHNGQVWEAVRSGVVHSPDEYAPDWRLVEPEPEPEPPEDEEPVDPEEPGPGDGDEGEDDEPAEPAPEPEPEPEPEPGTIDNPFAWEADVDYEADHYVSYNGALYRVRQAHKSAGHWAPDAAHSLYERQG